MTTKWAIFALLLAFLACTIPALASVPSVINYQGRLTQPSGAPVADATYPMLFSIYDAPTNGTALWSETNASVQVKGGLFATMLGSVTPIPATTFDSPSRYFAVKVASDAEMTPRQQIASVGYSFRAATVDDGAITASKLATGVATPAGAIMQFGGSSAPTGWLLCDGSTVSRTGANAALFAAIGTAYGAGDGSATFKLPDMRGRVPVGADGGAGRVTSNNTLGASAG